MAELSFGEWLRRQRTASGLTQKKLALQANCSTSAIKKFEAEERHPSPQIVAQLAAIFNIPEKERKAFLRFARGDWQAAPAWQSAEAPWRTPIPIPRTNLPTPLTSLIGRERELEIILRLLDQGRLVTLTGPGGAGKTRLAIQSSSRLLQNFRDGVCWVELAPLTDEALVPEAVSKALELREIARQSFNETLASFLRARELLLVLDNCEHLIAGCAQLAAWLLSTCPGLKILATSREALGLIGEEVWSVPMLTLPDPQRLLLVDLLLHYEGIHLFVERAVAVKSDFRLTDENAPVVAQVCQRLDGIPLAIELAAARVKMMSVAEINKRLDDRFELLTAGNRGALPRQQTLRAAIDWSYDLLSQPERRVFNRLSVFAGGFTLAGAEAVTAGDDLYPSQIAHYLGQLINKSLVTVAVGPEESEVATRYDMLETIRQYAREKLDGSGETERRRQAHRDFYVGFAEQAAPRLKGREQIEWLVRLEAEQDNWRAAWACALESDLDLALRLASALLDFWLMRGNPGEGREWLAKLLDRMDQRGQTAGRAQALSVAGRLAHFQADFAAARALLEQAALLARAAGDKQAMAFALLWSGRTALRQGDDRMAQSLIEEGSAAYHALHDERGIVVAFHRLAELAGHQGDQRQAEALFLKALASYRDFGDRFMAGEVLNALGEVARFEGDYQRAGAFYEQALEDLTELGSRFPPAIPLSSLAWVSLHAGNFQQANSLFAESLGLHREYGYKLGMVEECLGGFAAILAMTGKPEAAARLFGAAGSLLENSGMHGRVEPQDQKEFDHYVAIARGQLDEAAFVHAWAEGRGLTLQQAVAYALETSGS